MPELSIIIVNYNSFDHTINCISSILKNTVEIDYEIIVVDNASSDRDPGDFLPLFPNIILICNSSNLGFAKANNIGINASRGQYILLLNADTYLNNNAIDLAYRKMISDDTIGALTVHFTFPEGSFQQSSYQFKTILSSITYLFKLNKILRIKNTHNLNQQKIAHETDWISGAFLMTRKSIIEKFPDKKLHDFYFLYYEDVQWCYSIRKLGYRIAYLPDGEIVHMNKGGNKQLDEKEFYKKFILPSEILFYNYNKGKLYTHFIFFLKTIMKAQDKVIKGTKEKIAYMK